MVRAAHHNGGRRLLFLGCGSSVFPREWHRGGGYTPAIGELKKFCFFGRATNPVAWSCVVSLARVPCGSDDALRSFPEVGVAQLKNDLADNIVNMTRSP